MGLGGYRFRNATSEELFATYNNEIITTGNSANTFGSYGEIISSVGDRPVLILGVSLSDVDGHSFQSPLELEIATGAAASEVTVASVPFGADQADYKGYIPLNLYIPASTRLSGRAKEDAGDELNLIVNILYRKV